jgi:hypothetical protein
MNRLLLTSAIVAVFITMRVMEKPKPTPQRVAVSPSVERLLKTDKDEPDIRVIPLTKPPSEPLITAHESSDPPPVEPPKAAPKIEEVVPPVAPPQPELPKNFVLAPASPALGTVHNVPERNEGVCGRYGGYKVTTYRHGWQSWHCVYPHRR